MGNICNNLDAAYNEFSTTLDLSDEIAMRRVFAVERAAHARGVARVGWKKLLQRCGGTYWVDGKGAR